MSEVIALGGLAVAALALLITYLDRAAGHRSALYEQQLEGLADLSEGLGQYYVEVRNFYALLHRLPEAEPTDDRDQSLQRRKQDVVAAFSLFAKARRRWWPILPSRAIDAADEVYRRAQTLVSSDDLEDLRQSYLAFIQAIRAAASVDPLTAASLKLTGQAAIDQNRASQIEGTLRRSERS